MPNHRLVNDGFEKAPLGVFPFSLYDQKCENYPKFPT